MTTPRQPGSRRQEPSRRGHVEGRFATGPGAIRSGWAGQAPEGQPTRASHHVEVALARKL